MTSAKKPLISYHRQIPVHKFLLTRSFPRLKKQTPSLQQIQVSVTFQWKQNMECSSFFVIHHVDTWELDYEEGRAPTNWCFWIVVLEKTLESPLDSKIKPVNPKGNQLCIFIGRTDAEAPILWPPVVKNWLTGKDPDAGKDWEQEEKETTEDEMVGWHHQHNGHEFEQTVGDSEGQGSLACCSLWDHEEWGKTWPLNNNNTKL